MASVESMRNTTIYTNIPKTFRRSSKILITGQGSNLQNIKKELREIYIPDGFSKDVEQKCKYWLLTGDLSPFTQEELETIKVFCQTDQSGAEALIVAYDCEAGDYRQLFIHGVKPHVYIAMKLFKDVWRGKLKEKGGLIEDFDIDAISNTPIRDLKKNPFWRDLDLLIKDSDNWPLTERYYYFAKQTCHSANYDIQAPNFRMNVLEKSGGKVALSKEDSERFLLVYRSLFPEIPERNRRVIRQVEMTKCLYNFFGHPYLITDWNITGTAMKDMLAWGPQSTVGEITRIAITQMQQYIEETKQPWDNLADTHDSFLTQTPLYLAKECMKKQQEFMNQRLRSPVDVVEFNMKSECNVGFNWSSYKKDKNELGLQELKW